MSALFFACDKLMTTNKGGFMDLTTDLIAYAEKRGVTLTPAEASVALAKANDLLSTKCWKGYQFGDDAFPRTWLEYTGTPLLDVNGKPIEGLTVGDIVKDPATPRTVQTGIFLLAMDSAAGVDLMPTTAGKQVIEERIEGAVTMKYQEASIGAGPLFAYWDAMLGAWELCGTDADGINFAVMRG